MINGIETNRTVKTAIVKVALSKGLLRDLLDNFFPYDYAELPCLNYQCLASGIDT